MRFEHKTAVVATSGGSIGLACARLLRQEGARVALLDLDRQEAAGLEAADTLRVVPVECFYDPEEMEGKVKSALEGWGAAGVVVTCLTSRPPEGPWNEISEEEAHRVFDEIMTGVQTVLKYTVPAMIEREAGSVVIVQNLSGRTGVQGENVMTAAAYAGLGGLIRNMGTVFGKHLITVNGVSVGPIEGQYFEPAMSAGAQPVLAAAGTGEDAANAVMYLADQAVFWNTGEIVDLNGGRFAV